MGSNQIPPSLHTRRLNSSYHRHYSVRAFCYNRALLSSSLPCSMTKSIYLGYMRSILLLKHLSALKEKFRISAWPYNILCVISYLLSALRMRGNGLMIAVVGGTTTTWTTTQQLMQLTGVENLESGEAIHTFGFVMKHSFAMSELSHMLRWISVTNCALIIWLHFRSTNTPRAF